MKNEITLKDNSIFEDSNGNIIQIVKSSSGKYFLYDIEYEQWLHHAIEEYIFDSLENIIETYQSGGNPIEKVIQ